MNFSGQKLSIEEARRADITDYLAKLGHEPSKIKGSDYWYLSQLRNEKTPSFKVNRKLNRWYDHVLRKDGNIIDFAILYNNCTIGEFLHQLSNHLSFQKPFAILEQNQYKLNSANKIHIHREKPISSLLLLRYLQKRRIPIDIAECYCVEVIYECNGKKYFAIGFKNNSGGYELRNPYFKGSSSPKDITTFNNGAKEATVFEGFVDFLFFMAIHKNQSQNRTDFVILNSVAFFEKATPFMEKHHSIRLYLDQDTVGQNCSKYALSLNDKYKDESCLYQHHNDLNDWLVNFGKAQKENFKTKALEGVIDKVKKYTLTIFIKYLKIQWKTSKNLKSILNLLRLPLFSQSARCRVVSQPNLAAFYSGVVGGADEKKILLNT